MIPYSDPSEPGHVFPFVNIGLIVVNFLVFFYELSLSGQGVLNAWIGAHGIVPCEFTANCPTNLYPGTPSPFWVSLLTSMFMHAGWLHILGNMLFLWVFGDNVENSMGHLRYLIFYLLAGLAASALEILTDVTGRAPGLGASGAIAGVLAAYLMLYPRSRVRTLIPIVIVLIPVGLPAWVLIGFWFVEQFFNGVVVLASRTAVGGVAYWAHVGGFIAGAILVWFFRRPERVSRLRTYHHGGA